MRDLKIGETHKEYNDKVKLEIFQQNNYYILISYMVNCPERHNTVIVPGFYKV